MEQSHENANNKQYTINNTSLRESINNSAILIEIHYEFNEIIMKNAWEDAIK